MSRRRRIVPAVLAAALATTMLAGCRSNVGVAARVADDRISESDVNGYLDPKGVASDVNGQSGGQFSSRSFVLRWMILDRIFDQTLTRLNQPATSGELAALHDQAGSSLLNTQLKGDALDAQLKKELGRIGVKSSFLPELMRANELGLLLQKKGKITTESQFAAAVKPVARRVSVSPRFGTWDAQTLQLSNTPALPSFVTEQRASGSGA